MLPALFALRLDQPVLDHRAFAMPALDQQGAGLVSHHRFTAQRRQFGQIGRGQCGKAQEAAKGRDDIGIGEHRSAGRDHHGTEDDRQAQRFQTISQCMGGFGRSDHPDLDRIGADIAQHAVDLRHHHGGGDRMHRLHPQRVLRGDRGDRGHGMAAQHRHGLDAFEKMGVNLPNALKKAYQEGKTPLEAIAEITNKTLKGDLSKLGYLFEDSQVQQGLRPLIQNMALFRKIRSDAMKSDGTTDRDFAERMKDSAAQSNALKTNAATLAITLGSQLLPTVNSGLATLNNFATWIGDAARRHPTLTRAIARGAATFATLFLIRGGGAIVVAGLIAPFAALSFAAGALGIGLWHLRTSSQNSPYVFARRPIRFGTRPPADGFDRT